MAKASSDCETAELLPPRLTAPDRASVARALIKAARWRKDQTEEAVAVP